MRRRDFLTTTALGTTLAFVPSALRRALVFAADRCLEDQAQVVLRALRQGRRLGKPVVVFVVPDHAENRGNRESLFGMLIDLGPDRCLAMLALTEVVCAPLAAARCALPSTPPPTYDGTPLMLMIDPVASPPEIVAFPIVPTAVWELCPPKHDPADEVACWEQTTRAHCERMMAPLRRALLARGFRRRVRRNTRALGPESALRIRTAVATDGGASLPLGLIDDAAPLLLAHALEGRDHAIRRRTIAALAAAARRRLRDRPPPGARWQRFEGCGIKYAHPDADDELVGDMACGLGATPFLAARFLHFLTETDRRP